jgi:hypothetical protein
MYRLIKNFIPQSVIIERFGWRSLGEKCFYEDHDGMLPVDRAQAEAITLKWYLNEWPAKWAAIEAASSKAAF